ncbi:hypothetical protein LTR84_011602 [Exophiala bonariae]|uniref:CENP-V/GFA domain-containing protein n=1 Tax=Exophiala bonariae TaxID=1690606 RepID=A0AAV9NHI4_9EURO|nr:hypothetical protein LTR84_011602 [Exophiala bonariae]
MADQYNPDCNCNNCLSTVRLPSVILRNSAIQGLWFTNEFQSAEHLRSQGPHSQFSEDTVVILNEQQRVNQLYQRQIITNPDEYSVYQQNLRSPSDNGGNQLRDGGVTSNEFDPVTPDVQGDADTSVEQRLNPEAPALVFVAPNYGNGLNPEAPQFVPLSNGSRMGLNPEADTFVPSTNDTNRLDPEASMFLPDLATPDTHLMPHLVEDFNEVALEDSDEETGEDSHEETEEDFDAEAEEISDEEARFMAASQLSPDDFATKPLLWPPPGDFHHINYFGHTVYAKSYTTPAANLAILKSRGKYRASKYAENLRLHTLHAQASQWLDPLVFTGNVAALWHLEGTKLQDAAIGACFKLCHPDGDWKTDSWDEDDDYPVMDPVDPDIYTPGHVIINGRFPEPFLDRIDDISELNAEYGRFTSRQEEKRRKIQAAKAASKSSPATNIKISGLNKTGNDSAEAKLEVSDKSLPTCGAKTSNDDPFKANVEAFDKPMPANWADFSDDEADEPSTITDESWRDRLLPPQEDQGQPPLSENSLAVGKEPVDQDQGEVSLEFRVPKMKLPRMPLLAPFLPVICEEEDSEEDERTLFIEPATSNNVLVQNVSEKPSEASVASDLAAGDETPLEDDLPSGILTNIVGPATNSLGLRRKPHQEQPLYNIFNDIQTAESMDSTVNHVDSTTTPDVTGFTNAATDPVEATTRTPSMGLTATSPTSSTSYRPKNSSRAGKQKSVRFASPIVAANPPRVLRALRNPPLVPVASLTANATTIISRSPTSASASLTGIKKPSPVRSSESLAPVPALPTFTPVRPRRSWFPRLSGRTHSRPATEAILQDSSLAPVHRKAEGQVTSRRRRCLLKAGSQLWKKFRGLLSTKQRLE